METIGVITLVVFFGFFAYRIYKSKKNRKVATGGGRPGKGTDTQRKEP